MTEVQYLKYKKENNQTWYKNRKFLAQGMGGIFIIDSVNYDRDDVHYEYIEGCTGCGYTITMPYYDSILFYCSEMQPEAIERISKIIEKLDLII